MKKISSIKTMILLISLSFLSIENAQAVCYIYLNSCPVYPATKSKVWFVDSAISSQANLSICENRAQQYRDWCGTDGAMSSYYQSATAKPVNSYALSQCYIDSPIKMTSGKVIYQQLKFAAGSESNCLNTIARDIANGSGKPIPTSYSSQVDIGWTPNPVISGSTQSVQPNGQPKIPWNWSGSVSGT